MEKARRIIRKRRERPDMAAGNLGRNITRIDEGMDKEYLHSGDQEKLMWKQITKDGVGYDRNRIIRPEPEPEFRFRLAGTGSGFLNSGSGLKNRNKHFKIPVPVQKNRN